MEEAARPLPFSAAVRRGDSMGASVVGGVVEVGVAARAGGVVAGVDDFVCDLTAVDAFKVVGPEGRVDSVLVNEIRDDGSGWIEVATEVDLVGIGALLYDNPAAGTSGRG